MDMHKLFNDFNLIIKLNKSKISKLKSNRKALREKIRIFFKEKEWDSPKFYSQGSFPLNTNLNPIKKTLENGDIKEEYDLDDGIYFICSSSDRKEPSTYHDRIKNAIDGHAESVIDKTTCVRVVYSDGHHIDLPSYWIEKDGNIPQLTHKTKGYVESDPKAFKDWVDKKISDSNSNGQLKRIIRYLKAWKDFRENSNSSMRLPSGFILTILACNYFCKDDRDDLSLKDTIENIKTALNLNFCCYRPTIPIYENLLEKYSKDKILQEFDKIIENAKKGLDSECEKESSEFWQNVFGDRFPLGEEKDKKNSIDGILTSSIPSVKANPPWTSA